MRLTMRELAVELADAKRDRLLDDWQWLVGRRRPVLVTAMGDAFLQDPDGGAIAFLDVQAAQLDPVADDADAFRRLLEDEEFVREYFAVDWVAEFRETGLTLAPDQVYSWNQPPVLGGDYAVENASVTDVEVHFSFMGQIHEQVRDLPPGTRIRGVDLSE